MQAVSAEPTIMPMLIIAIIVLGGIFLLAGGVHLLGPLLHHFGLIALGPFHLLEVGEPELVLRIVRAPIGGIERQKLLEFVDRQHERLGGPLPKVGVANPEFGIRAERALRVSLGDRLNNNKCD
jgi:hypothetical protein